MSQELSSLTAASTHQSPAVKASNQDLATPSDQSTVQSQRILERDFGAIMRSSVLSSEAKEALNSLVRNGKVSEEALKTIKNLIEIKDTAVLKSGMTGAQAKEFVNSLLVEANNPYELNQGRHAGCTVISMMFDLARQDAGAYLKLGLDLAGQGVVTLKNSDPTANKLVINRSAFNQALTDPSGRYENLTMSERVMMASLMDYGNGGQSSYNFQIDQSTGFSAGGKQFDNYTGLYQHQYLKIANGLFGGVHRTVNDRQVAQDYLSNPKNNPQGTLVDIKWDQAGETHANHMVVFMGFDETGEYVKIRNPWGQEHGAPNSQGPLRDRRPDLGKGIELIKASEFFSRINAIVVKDNSAGATPMTKQDDPSLQPEPQFPQFQGVAIHDRSNGYDFLMMELFGKKSEVQLSVSEQIQFKEKFPELSVEENSQKPKGPEAQDEPDRRQRVSKPFWENEPGR